MRREASRVPLRVVAASLHQDIGGLRYCSHVLTSTGVPGALVFLHWPNHLTMMCVGPIPLRLAVGHEG